MAKKAKKTPQEKSLERLQALELAGQYKNGQYYSRAGTARMLGYWDGDTFVEPVGGHSVHFEARPVDAARLNEYRDLWEHLGRKAFPAGAVWGASWDSDDIDNRCRDEVFKALVDTFDPAEAMVSRVDEQNSPKGRMSRHAWEKDMARDVQKQLAVVERGWVKKRLENFLRRTQYNYHPERLADKNGNHDASLFTQSISALLEGGPNRECRNNLSYEPVLVADSSREAVDTLLEALETAGPDEVTRIVNGMSRSAREEVIEIIESCHDKRQDLGLNDDALQELTSTRDDRGKKKNDPVEVKRKSRNGPVKVYTGTEIAAFAASRAPVQAQPGAA
jgi:hypothetical protein